jgi:hypothetical protein
MGEHTEDDGVIRTCMAHEVVKHENKIIVGIPEGMRPAEKQITFAIGFERTFLT